MLVELIEVTSGYFTEPNTDPPYLFSLASIGTMASKPTRAFVFSSVK